MARARPDVEAIRGICGMIPTPSTPGADRWSEPMTIAVDETARMVERIVAGGVAILLTNGSLGEGASLTAAEHRVFTATVAEAMAGRGLLFAGVTTLNTRETIERARAAIDAGADGLFMGRPMWMSLDGPSIVAYYADVAEALPGVPIVVYDNPFAFKAKIATETYRALSLNRAIVATKHIGGPAMAVDVRAVEGRMRILPLDQHWAALAKDHPDEALGCWSGNVADGTEPFDRTRTRGRDARLGPGGGDRGAHGLGSGADVPGRAARRLRRVQRTDRACAAAGLGPGRLRPAAPALSSLPGALSRGRAGDRPALGRARPGLRRACGRRRLTALSGLGKGGRVV